MNQIIGTKPWIRIIESSLLGLMGLALIIWPGNVFSYIGLVLGLFLIVYGGLYLLMEFFSKHFHDRLVGFIVAGAYLAIGIVLVSIPKEVVQTIVGLLIGILILAQGLSTTAQAIYERRFGDSWLLKLVVGLVVTFIGAFSIFNAQESSEVFLILIGGVLVFIAISQVFSTLFLIDRLKPTRERKARKSNPKIIDAEIIDEKKED